MLFYPWRQTFLWRQNEAREKSGQRGNQLVKQASYGVQKSPLIKSK